MLPVSVAGGGQAVVAEPSALPPIDPPGVWHALTQDDATTESKCIGNPVTPLCAVETVIACFVRGSDELCRIGKGLDRPPGLFRGRPGIGVWERYRVAVAKRINPKKQPFLNEEPTKAGDVSLGIQSLFCQKVCETPDGPPTTYLIRPMDGRWVVLTWETPRW
ncbi:hypothetical protein [Magnetospirillum molischianum]|uniref:hypothetical protein n=1 Tax=Magnetospirillum molischianum TaxID=1083 RepID=UPI0012DDAE87|nr:hypothetical protein [Magnetospirillum molischianum]